MNETSPQPLFREEALAHHARPEARGSLLQLSPLWARGTYWVLVVLVVCGGVMLSLVDINDYGQGPTFIQVKGLEDVAATVGGRVSRVLVQRGQRVKAGDPLVELYSNTEKAERERVAQEFRTQMAALLINPLNTSARQAVAGLGAQLELSDTLLAERALLAPHDGVVNEIRARSGQFLSQGEVVASILRDGAESWAL
ncbi:efflux RND transporter periplasmic adaptor subunit, partial [Hyalangium sp.]|uniref:efflux RND transporter periplasmic adaptor subunit n=1 Tax=Hyalangium sp. TaxID=2028555 RepID=UPI002D58C18D